MKTLLHAAVAVLSFLLFFMQPQYAFARAVTCKNFNIGQYLFKTDDAMKTKTNCTRFVAFITPKYKKDPDIDSELIGQEPIDES